jgi:hypothetical protein
MTSTKTLVAAALLSAMTATPVLAQAAIQEPGEFSFYHPNLDVLNGGAPPWTSPHASQSPQAMQDYAARESGIASSAAHRYRAYNFLGDAYRGRSRR